MPIPGQNLAPARTSCVFMASDRPVPCYPDARRSADDVRTAATVLVWSRPRYQRSPWARRSCAARGSEEPKNRRRAAAEEWGVASPEAHIASGNDCSKRRWDVALAFPAADRLGLPERAVSSRTVTRQRRQSTARTIKAAYEEALALCSKEHPAGCARLAATQRCG